MIERVKKEERKARNMMKAGVGRRGVTC